MTNSEIFDLTNPTILPKVQPNKKGIKYHYNRYFFKVINTPEKAYFLGFFMGDGSIHKSREFIAFNIHPQDSDVLKKLVHAIGGSLNQIKYHDYKTPTAYLSLASKDMIQDLFNLGVPKRNKTFNAKPIKLDLDLMPFFWRGIFDADGSITKKGRGLQLNFSGTKSNVEAFTHYLGYNLKKIRLNKKTFVFQTSISNSKEMIRAYHLLYGIPDVGMGRKRNLFRKIIEDRIKFEKEKNAIDPEKEYYLQYKECVAKNPDQCNARFNKARIFQYIISDEHQKEIKK